MEFWDVFSQKKLASHSTSSTPLLSPNFEYALVFDKVVNLESGQSVTINGTSDSFWAAVWSPDAKLVATAACGPCSFVDPAFECSPCDVTLRDSASGATLRTWILPGANYVRGMCWSPSPLISIQYHSNGTLASLHQVGARWSELSMSSRPSMFITISCNADSAVVETNDRLLQLVDRAGNVFTREQDEEVSADAGFVTLRQVSKAWGGIVLGVCGPRQTCKLFDSTLHLLLDVTEAPGHIMLGLSSDDKTLATLFSGTIYWWDVHTPHILTQLPLSNDLSTYLGPWITRHMMILNSNQEFNVYTGHYGASFPCERACTMDGEFYCITGGLASSSISVFAERAQTMGPAWVGESWNVEPVLFVQRRTRCILANGQLESSNFES